MPKSKSKRSSYTPPKPAKPKHSAPWVPVTGLGLALLGILVIVMYYLVDRWPGGGLNLILGFALMAAGLGVLTRWR